MDVIHKKILEPSIGDIEYQEAIEAIEGHYRALTKILLNNRRRTVIIKMTWNMVKELRSICKLAYYHVTGEDLKEIIRKEEQNNDN